ncbi:MAG: hypothetical protein J0M13_11575 [Candidatus Accumulibacter sp.]|nr:hypothetical protein [Candidatus Accumulibacter necessarius]
MDRTPLESRLDALRPVELRAVRRTPLEGLFDHLITDSHYIGPLQGVGEQIKHLAFGAGRPLAAWASHHFELWILSPYSHCHRIPRVMDTVTVFLEITSFGGE